MRALILFLLAACSTQAGWYPPVGLQGGNLAKMKGDLSMQSQAKVKFGDSDSSNYISLQSSGVMASDITWTLPSAVCSTNQSVKFSDGTGTMECYTPSGSADVANTAYTPSTQGFGTISAQTCWYAYDAGTKLLKVNCLFTTGTTTASEARVDLPAGYTISNSSSKLGAYNICGLARSWSAAANDVWQFPILQRNVTYINFAYMNSGSATIALRNGNDIVGSSTVFNFECTIPID